MNDLNRKFLTNTSETGRFIVTSIRTGKKYYVEPLLGGNLSTWGDLNPATKKLEGNYGKKYTGAIESENSLIVKENGFDKIHDLSAGMSPLLFIEKLDEKYPNKD